MKVRRLTLTKIEYGNLNYNFYPGCRHWQNPAICPVGENCWAKKEAHQHGRDFEPHLIPELLLAPLRVKKPKIILVNFAGEIGGEWVDPNQVLLEYYDEGVQVASSPGRVIHEIDGYLKSVVFGVMKLCPQHTFLFLTKNPKGLVPWGPFPDNALVGATVWDAKSMAKACIDLARLGARHKWLSIEPLLGMIVGSQMDVMLWKTAGIDWIVLGAQSNPVKYPDISWVKSIVEAANDAGIPIWLKNNLYKLLMEAEDHDLYFEDMSTLRQERPERNAIV